MTQDETWLLKEKYAGQETDAFFADCARLRTGEPLAYIIGSIPFLHTHIYLDSHPLIPRTETEYWVEQCIRELKEKPAEQRAVLDLCAGSGCIGVAILKDVEDARVDFAEIDVTHHTTIQRNLRENGIDASRTHIYGGDLFEHISRSYDYILTNPPYIDRTLNQTDTSVDTFEPHLALYGGTNGIEVITKIISASAPFLKPNGVLIIEHDPEATNEITARALTHGYTCASLYDQFGVLRYSRLTQT